MFFSDYFWSKPVIFLITTCVPYIPMWKNPCRWLEDVENCSEWSAVVRHQQRIGQSRELHIQWKKGKLPTRFGWFRSVHRFGSNGCAPDCMAGFRKRIDFHFADQTSSWSFRDALGFRRRFATSCLKGGARCRTRSCFRS